MHVSLSEQLDLMSFVPLDSTLLIASSERLRASEQFSPQHSFRSQHRSFLPSVCTMKPFSHSVLLFLGLVGYSLASSNSTSLDSQPLDSGIILSPYLLMNWMVNLAQHRLTQYS